MRRFFSVWLVWLVVLVFGLAIIISYFILTGSSEAAAKADLTTLTDAAFIQLDMANQSAASAVNAADSNLITKGRAIERFLAHDDTLLTGDALQSLCDMLEIASVDVADGEGVVTASSIPGNIGTNLVTDANISWIQDTLDNNTEQVHPDGGNASLLLGVVPRTDIDGLLLIQVQDASVKEARAAADPETVLSRMSFINDDLSVATAAGTDGAYIMDGFYCVRSTRSGVSVIASRLLSSVYLLRNSILLALAIFMLASLLAAMLIQVLLVGGGRRHYVVKRSFNDDGLPAWLTDETMLPEEEMALIEATEKLTEETTATQAAAETDAPEAPEPSPVSPDAKPEAAPKRAKSEKKRKQKKAQAETTAQTEATAQVETVPVEDPPAPDEKIAPADTTEAASGEVASGEVVPAEDAVPLEEGREPQPLDASPRKRGKRKPAPPEDAEDAAGFDRVF